MCDQTANYAGAQASLDVTIVKNNDIQVGVYGFAQHQSNFFNNVFTDCAPSCQNFGPSSAAVTGGLVEEFISDRFKVTSWLTLIAGLRESHFDSGSVPERSRESWRTRPTRGLASSLRSPAAELGVSWLLRRVLSGAAAADGYRSAARL